ncbi:MAG TPA: chemotaxis protein CheX [Spirochaetota bacterium]|nr:chemotaxis protein CheX [Spirochaetota bacterium]HNT09418.1 chemotaxis protein CheX [Spirochaetota bacterium]HNV48023.1 chemotaxis protein CheX [Spirochaetota bacterium]HOS40678.1 chemotaxis protein CheX [Spirochaetota bacterium]HPI24060.1 chemotaxis protein CheX [Spirochaetota bacterium]
MDKNDRYSRYIARSVDHIFKNFIKDDTITEVFEAQSHENDPRVCIELAGTISGEIVINIPEKTLSQLTKKIMPSVSPRAVRKHHREIAGEIANMITGTFANQLQFIKHNVRLSAPEFNEDPIALKTFYENVNLSFQSAFGGFDIDLYYKESAQ